MDLGHFLRDRIELTLAGAISNIGRGLPIVMAQAGVASLG